MALRTCYDFLRHHQRRRETAFSDLSEAEANWLEGFRADPDHANEHAEAARVLVHKLLDRLSPAARLVVTLLEIEERSVKEVAALTGWSVSLVKVRAFRARAEMRKCLKYLVREQYL
jgi:RNA polymerase sigma-70 factor (ECF subfamily)